LTETPANSRPEAVEVDGGSLAQDGGGRRASFKDAETLIGDFFDEVERVLKEHGIPFETVEAKEGDRP
jgi:hypothetical protein